MTFFARAISSFLLGALFFQPENCLASGSPSFDLVVYGATAGGVLTAVAAAREGLRVVLLDPGNNIGGMVTGGLSATDIGNPRVIGGYALEFFKRIGQVYQVERYGQTVSWRSEPHVAETVFLSMLRESGVELNLHERLREHDGVIKAGNHLVSITTEDGKVWQGEVFADASYEGDLMAQAGVSYAWGREGTAQYGESLAGVRAQSEGHQFKFNLSAYGPDGKLLPEIQNAPMAPAGSADQEVESYNFRLILTKDPANRIPYPKPLHYDSARYTLLEKYIEGFTHNYGHPPGFRDLTNPVDIPNDKADFNNNGPFSTDYLGKSWKYPETSYAEREAIWRDHVDYTQGFFYFLATDPSVPPSLHAEVNQWGPAKDEFLHSDHWPPQLYVREARRMLGVYVMTQRDLQTERSKPDSIGMGSYNIDSHNAERVATHEGWVHNEGDVQVPVQPYEIPYRILLPQDNQAGNLLIPVCVSASHIGYSSLRMEPQYMILGQAAGIAASIAVRQKLDVQKIDIAILQQKLRAQGAILDLN